MSIEMEAIKKSIYESLLNNDYDAAEGKLITYFNQSYPVEDDLCLFAAQIAIGKNLYGLAKYYLQRGYYLNPDNTDIISQYQKMFGDILTPEENNLLYDQKRFRIVMVVGFYEALDLFADEYIKTYILMGHSVHVFNVKDEERYSKLTEFLSKGIDFVFGFNHSVLAMHVGNYDYVINRLKCPVIDQCVDHVFFGRDSIKDIFNDKRFVICAVDREDVSYINDCSGMNITGCFVPHGGIDIGGKKKKLSERSISVLYVGASKNYPKEGDYYYQVCADLMTENPNLSSFEVVDKVFEVVSEDPEQTIYGDPQLVYDHLLSSELVALGVYRTRMVQKLVESGIKVEVHGPGWDQLPFSNHPNLIIGEQLTPKECLEKMKESILVLNSMPWFKDGSHERIMNAMLAGSIALTDTSNWIEENFTSGEDILTFDLENMDACVSDVKLILDNPDRFQYIADRGYQKAVTSHTWSHRAIEILEKIIGKF